MNHFPVYCAAASLEAASEEAASLDASAAAFAAGQREIVAEGRAAQPAHDVHEVGHVVVHEDRFEAAAALLDYGFGGWQAAPLPAPEVQPLQLKVKGSAEDSVPLDYSALPQTVLLPREGTAALTAQACLPQQLEAPVEKGQTVGTVQVYHGETLLGEYEVKAAADAPRMDFGTAFSLLWGSLTG